MPELTLELVIAFALTIVAGAVVALTRVRLRSSHAGLPLWLHTGLGVVGTSFWLAFLAIGGDSDWDAFVGVIGLGCWWVVSICGLILLARWKSTHSRGKRALTSDDTPNGLGGSPLISAVAHIGLFGIALWFTYAYLTSVI